MSYQTPSFPTTTWDGTSPTYTTREIDTLPDSSMTDRFISEIVAIQNLLYDSQGPIEFLSTLGSANTVIAIDTAGSALKYKSIIGGTNVTVSSSNSAITISATGGGETVYSAEAGEDLYAGQPVAFSSGKIVGTTSDSHSFIGIATEDITSGLTGNFSVDGKLELADWTTATGSAALTQGSIYFVNATTLSSTPPSTGYILKVGRAISTTVMDIEISPPIKL